MSCSLPGTSTILPPCHSTRTVFSAVDPALVLAGAGDEVLGGDGELALAALFVAGAGAQLDRPVGPDQRLVLLLGRLGISSNCVTLAAPWRLLVPTQSLPVSPPPMTITCLPSAVIWPLSLSPATTLFCCGRNSIAKCTPSSSRPGTGRSRLVSAPPVSSTASNSACSCSALMVSLASLVTLLPSGSAPTSTPVRKTTPSACICSMRRSMWRLLHLEVGDAVAQQAADAAVLLEHRHRVAGARQLLRRGQAGRAASRRRPPSCRSCAAGGCGMHPALGPGAVDDGVLDALDAHRVVVDVQRAGRLAGRRADAAGELGEVVGRVQHLDRVAASRRGTPGR